MKTYFIYCKNGTTLSLKAKEHDFKRHGEKDTLAFFGEKGEEVAVFNLEEIIGFMDSSHAAT